ncbi:MAG: CoA-transferase [Candidatus Hodarchaeota archaeon]
MKVLYEGEGELIGWHDPDENREWILRNKSRALADKTMELKEAIRKFVPKESVLALGGFGAIRTSLAAVYEIIRQGIADLTLLGKTAAHDLDVLIGGGVVSKVEAAYSFAHEMRGLSPAGRRAVETGEVEVVAEISNAGFQWRFLGGMMGVPFVPTRTMLGTETLQKSSAKVVEDPFTRKPICLVPSVNPDVAIIHVPRCDRFGNCQIDGAVIEDFELARAARRLIITTETLIDNETIRSAPEKTLIPFFLVDAVVEVKYGAHPAQMPYLYYFDEEHIGEWLKKAKTEEGLKDYLDRYIYGVNDFSEYLLLIGGEEQMKYLYEVEHYRKSLKAPWLDKKHVHGKSKIEGFTSAQIMTVAAAKVLEDNSTVFVGTGLPMIAAMFAQRTHAPNLVLIFEAGSIGPQIRLLPISVGESRTYYRALATSSMHDTMSLSQAGWLDYGFLGAAQIDKYGNINTTFIGDSWKRPIVRLPGSGGANDVGSFCRKTIIIMKQTKERFVAELDFMTTPGYLGGLNQREAAGLPKNTGPIKVISQLGVYDFDGKTKEMRLEAIHPGVSVEDIKKNSSFEIITPSIIRKTLLPTPEEIALLQELDPTGMAIGK